MTIDNNLLRKIVEGALLAANGPLSVAKIAGLFEPPEGTEPDPEFDSGEKPSKEDILAVLEDIQADCKGRGYELKEVGSGWRFQVVQETAHWINRLWEEKPQKYSRALLETLALIAYRQPITRGDIESIRGVAVSSTIVKTLTEREWVKVVGHRDVPGRPALYATTRQFLDYFNLKSLDELPSLKEIQDLDQLASELDLSAALAGAGAAQAEEASEADGGASAEAVDTEEAGLGDDSPSARHDSEREEDEDEQSAASDELGEYDSEHDDTGDEHQDGYALEDESQETLQDDSQAEPEFVEEDDSDYQRNDD